MNYEIRSNFIRKCSEFKLSFYSVYTNSMMNLSAYRFSNFARISLSKCRVTNRILRHNNEHSQCGLKHKEYTTFFIWGITNPFIIFFHICFPKNPKVFMQLLLLAIRIRSDQLTRMKLHGIYHLWRCIKSSSI